MPACVLDDLRRFGPGCTPLLSLREAQSYCVRLTRSHYENFSVLSFLTPRSLRPALASVYAFCRWSDDLGDEVGDPVRSRELLAWWRSELEATYACRARHPVMMALSETIHQFGIPIGPIDSLISAFEQDQVVTDYSTYGQLLDYCRRSANPVGHLVLYLGRAYTTENARLADLTCTGLQLANFWQDVERDMRIGRIYLPREDRERFSCGELDIRARRFTPSFAAMLEFEVERARALLLEGRAIFERLPSGIAWSVNLFSMGGLAILDSIKRQGFDVLTSRPQLTRSAKARLMARAFLVRSFYRPRRRRSSFSSEGGT
ncbi:MAG: squalene synthase HpnC [Isosphaeraceae bacterium]